MSGFNASTGHGVVDQTLNNTLGAVFLGIVGATFLFGVTTLQTYLYYHHYDRDTHLHKIAVAVLWLLDLIHLVFIIHAVYYYAIKGFGDFARLGSVVWSVKVSGVIHISYEKCSGAQHLYHMLLGSSYHQLFTPTVFGSWVDTTMVFWAILWYVSNEIISQIDTIADDFEKAGVVAGGFGIGIALAYKVYTIQTFQELELVSWAIDTSLATSTTIDFTIASAMCFYLHKSQGTESRLNSRISTIMQYTLSSGLFTSACSLSTLFTYTLMPNNLIFLSLQFLSTKFYAGSFLAMLNARQRRSRNESLNGEEQPEGPQEIEFRVDTTTTATMSIHTDVDSHWQHESFHSTLSSSLSTSTSSSSPPISPSDTSETQSTYVSFELESKKQSWDVEARPVVATVYS
ncbi:hypothetical protein D9757_007963 [Collybiopsis confluens]|uniref:DUF6534 domain-containing protein n=1 Tax=Collybiopsis confluens TaxID=2823264 RepID=A0A8H5HBR1_9AGAR|nr:hypothetical protein D9757_007963 [Collybiopsis confluens]